MSENPDSTTTMVNAYLSERAKGFNHVAALAVARVALRVQTMEPMVCPVSATHGRMRRERRTWNGRPDTPILVCAICGHALKEPTHA